jgi:hypothetical protein
LETDRNAVLIKRAFLRKVITSADCEPNSAEWWQRTMPLVYAMHELDDLELLKTAHKHQCALIAHGGLKEDSFKDVQTRAKDLFQDMINILHPWEQKQTKKEGYDDLIEMFKRHFGDPNDPAVQERIKKEEEEVAVLAAQKEAEEAKIRKKLEEFEEKLTNRNLRKSRGIKK